MTNAQARVLARIRSCPERTLAVGLLTTYQGRSIDALIREGYLRLIVCGACLTCQLNADGRHDRDHYHCTKARVQAL